MIYAASLAMAVKLKFTPEHQSLGNMPRELGSNELQSLQGLSPRTQVNGQYIHMHSEKIFRNSG